MKLLETTTAVSGGIAEGVSEFGSWLDSLPGKLFESIPEIIAAAVIIIIGFFLSKLAGKLLIKIMQK